MGVSVLVVEFVVVVGTELKMDVLGGTELKMDVLERTELKMDVLEGVWLRKSVLEGTGPKIWGAGPAKTGEEERRRERMADKSILVVIFALKYG